MSTALASIQPILSVTKHPNADLLDIVRVLGFDAIVKRDAWRVGDLSIFIQPDSHLPEVPWSAFYRAKGSRVKAIRLRQVWSLGIVESFENVGYTGPREPGLDIAAAIGVTKYVAPEPQDLAASGPYGYGIPRTDEERFENLTPGTGDMPPWGTLVDVTLKVDGQSISFISALADDTGGVMPLTWHRHVGGRSFLYKLDCDNNYTRNERQYNVLDKLEAFCQAHGSVPLCIRGESYGQGIQKGAHNPHSKLPLGLALYSTWMISERRYARKGEPYYIFNIAAELGLPTVPRLEKDVPLTPELIKRYSDELEVLPGTGLPFEGVVIQWSGGSFKALSKHFDQKKG